ncbi:MAG: hypothetical protein H6704_23705 [Myxococcales bacterium]|nr:hypothetical protein [Myxococcales bacterium]
MPSPVRPIRALTHPLWWVALALLVINDHLFKGAGVLPQPIVGKLSDFAGLFAAPMVLAALLRLRDRRAVAAAHGAVALVFAGINLSPAFAGGFEALAAATPWPWSIYVDPTDLVALPMVPLSWALLVPWAARPAPSARALLPRAGLAVGAWACVATSPPPEPAPLTQDNPPGAPQLVFPSAVATFVLANDTPVGQVVRVRAVRDDIDWACPSVVAAPDVVLRRDDFGPAETWILDPQRALPLRVPTFSGCGVWLIEVAGAPPRVAAWLITDYFAENLPTHTDDLVDHPRALRLAEIDGAPVLLDHAVLHPAPPTVADAPTDACAAPAAGAGLDWTPPPYGTHTLEARTVGADGCHALTFDAGRWYLCLPRFPLPFEAGDTLTIRAIGQAEEGVEIEGPGARLRALRGPLPLPGTTLESIEGCVGHRRDCGAFVEPLTLTVEGRTARAGEALILDDTRTLHVVRAEYTPLHTAACGAGRVDKAWAETVLIETLEDDR